MSSSSSSFAEHTAFERMLEWLGAAEWDAPTRTEREHRLRVAKQVVLDIFPCTVMLSRPRSAAQLDERLADARALVANAKDHALGPLYGVVFTALYRAVRGEEAETVYGSRPPRRLMALALEDHVGPYGKGPGIQPFLSWVYVGMSSSTGHNSYRVVNMAVASRFASSDELQRELAGMRQYNTDYRAKIQPQKAAICQARKQREELKKDVWVRKIIGDSSSSSHAAAAALPLSPPSPPVVFVTPVAILVPVAERSEEEAATETSTATTTTTTTTTTGTHNEQHTAAHMLLRLFSVCATAPQHTH